MSYTRDENWLKREDDGSYYDEKELQKAIDIGAIKVYDCGRILVDPETGQEFWPDGKVK